MRFRQLLPSGLTAALATMGTVIAGQQAGGIGTEDSGQCLSCTPDACAAILSTSSAAGLAACNAWLSVTLPTTVTMHVDAATTSTTTVSSDITVTTTRTTHITTGSMDVAISTSTQMLVKRQQRSSSMPPPLVLSTNSGVVVPSSVPALYAAGCSSDLTAFFSACLCMGATRTTAAAGGSTATVTVTGGIDTTTQSSVHMSTTSTVQTLTDTSVTTSFESTTTATAAPTGRLVVRSGGPVSGQYVFADPANDTPDNEAIALQFTPSRTAASIFSIDTNNSALIGYRPGMEGAQDFTMTGNATSRQQSQDNFYNAMLLVPSAFANNVSLPVPVCRDTGPGRYLRCVESGANDMRSMFQYCQGNSSWFEPFGYSTLGFLVLDSQIDLDCTQVDLMFESL